jgi:hypothetical protein
VLPAPQLDLEVYCGVLEVLLRPLEELELRSCSDGSGEFRRVRIEIRVSACVSRTSLWRCSSFFFLIVFLNNVASRPNCCKDDSFLERDTGEENGVHAKHSELRRLPTIVCWNDGRESLIATRHVVTPIWSWSWGRLDGSCLERRGG